jgi:hypothetical protein
MCPPVIRPATGATFEIHNPENMDSEDWVFWIPAKELKHTDITFL